MSKSDAGAPPQPFSLTRRQMLKATAAGGAAAAVGSGAVDHRDLSPVEEAQAIAPVAAWALVGATAAGVNLARRKDWFSDPDVSEDLNSESYIYNIAATIEGLRSGSTGTRRDIQRDIANATTDESAYAQAAASQVVGEAALATLEGDSQNAQNRADRALREQTTRSLVSLVEKWNAGIIEMQERGAFVEDVEAGTDVLGMTNNNVGIGPLTQSETGDGWEPVEASSPEGQDGYLVHKWTFGSSALPADPTNLEGRDEPLELWTVPHWHDSYSEHVLPVPDHSTSWFQTINESSSNSVMGREDLFANYSNGDKVYWLKGILLGNVIQKIETEYENLLSELSDVVDKTVNGLEQGTIEPSDVLTSEQLTEDFNPNNRRSALHREAMAVGMEMPGDVAFQARVSHPDLAADSLWGDLLLRTTGDSDLAVDGPMTIPAADYQLALLGYTGETTGKYQYASLRPQDSNNNDQPLEILEITTNDDVVAENPETSVGSGGTVKLAPTDSESTPEPLANPDQKYDSWGITVVAGDGTTATGKVGDAYGEDGYWKLNTSLSEGLSVEEIRYHPDSLFQDTSIYTPGQTDYSVDEAKQQIDVRRAVNEAIREEFGSVIDGGGLFDGGLFDGLPSLPGLGVLESAAVVGGGTILGLLGLSAASG